MILSRAPVQRPAIRFESRALRTLQTMAVERRFSRRYAEKELPQPQPPVAVGFLNVKPEPCIDVT